MGSKTERILVTSWKKAKTIKWRQEKNVPVNTIMILKQSY